MAKEKQPLFDLCGGHPVLDFINSLDHRFRQDGPVELLTSYADLLRFSEQTHLLDPGRARSLANSVDSDAGARALRSARELREAMAAIFYGKLDANSPPAEAIHTLEWYLHSAERRKKLRWEQSGKNGKQRSGLRWDWDRFEIDEHLPVWMLADAAVQLLVSPETSRVRACNAETCRWLFLDTSKNHTRRWCNMKVCGNRMKARRFHARRAE